MTRVGPILVVLLVAAALVGPMACSDSPVSPTPPPTLPPREPPRVPEVAGATRGASEGETSIFLVGADPLPGATLGGCGRGASGCSGRIRMTLRLEAPVSGSALGLLAFLHSDRATACFRAVLPALALEAGRGLDVEVVFDPVDTDEACPTPLDLTHLAVVVEGNTDLFARQEWALRYHLER